ncbi:peptidylprolyl isomerase [Alteromonas sp. ASW11-19]|uniref:peptidylprolyl isomerase n=1 Tax=Alteromonas salexigens TaxID=2982530 RepID=A0ABT2VLA8_9ALTE|nr:peptidylprolyl isomerase [Alteromonas salexigens]MCU7553824.1 peptidylprolyl isomerase [Alteromonas salexigens]
MPITRVFFSVLFPLLVSLSAVAEQAPDNADWYLPKQKDLVYLQTHTGDVVIMLSDAVAPLHKQRFVDLVNSGFYDNRYFYRVIEGFVAQAGSNTEQQTFDLATPLKAEFVKSPVAEDFVSVETDAPHAPETGFIRGVPAAIDKQADSQWLIHCPGAVAFARDNEPDTATTEFYVVIGQAPRHLDKNMSVIGKVLDGMAHLQALPRGNTINGGVITSPTDASKILSVRMGDTVPVDQQRQFRVQKASHPGYQRKINSARTLENAFFHDKSLTPRTIDVCYYQPGVEEISKK